MTMNRFDEKYIFKIADMEELDDIMGFIREYWNKDHILANDKDFFLYEFQNGDKLNYFLARSKETNAIEAIMGFYPYEKEMKPKESCFSGGILKVYPKCAVPMLGVEMLRRIYALMQQKAYIGNGANPVTALPLETRVLRHHGGRHRHFYILDKRDEYKIAKIVKQPQIMSSFSTPQKPLMEYQNVQEMYQVFDDAAFKERIPYKDAWYVQKRYFSHSIYHYQMFGIGTKTVLVGREVNQNGAKVFRLVDILGDVTEIRYAGAALRELIEHIGYEYIDLYEHGVPEDALKEAGFVERTENDSNIIPNYFEPFVQKNIEIYYHTDAEDAVIFKADGDQDRPNFR